MCCVSNNCGVPKSFFFFLINQIDRMMVCVLIMQIDFTTNETILIL